MTVDLSQSQKDFKDGKKKRQLRLRGLTKGLPSESLPQSGGSGGNAGGALPPPVQMLRAPSAILGSELGVPRPEARAFIKQSHDVGVAALRLYHVKVDRGDIEAGDARYLITCTLCKEPTHASKVIEVLGDPVGGEEGEGGGRGGGGGGGEVKEEGADTDTDLARLEAELRATLSDASLSKRVKNSRKRYVECR